MIFLTSLFYAVLLFVVPGEWLLMGLAGAVPGVPTRVALVGLNVLAYGVVFSIVYLGHRVYGDFRLGERQAKGVRLADWLEINQCRWLNLLGLLAIAGGACVLASAGRLAPSFWFLYAAIIAGSLDILRKNRLVPLPTDLPPARLAPDTPAAADAGKRVEFAWHTWQQESAVREESRVAFVISTTAYQRARTQNRYPTGNPAHYVRYVKEPFGQAVADVAAYFRQQSDEKQFTAVQELANVVCFTRSIVYATDETTRGVPEWANFPIETLYDQAGDCEDHAILAAAILHHLGHDVAVFILEFADGGHVALGYQTASGTGPFSGPASNGREYFYVETVPTSDDERIGDISLQFLHRIKHTVVLAVE